MNPIVDLVYFNAGGGHRAAALALRDALQRQGVPWTVRLVNLTEVLDPAQRIKSGIGRQPEDLYNLRLRSGWTVGLATELKILQAAIAAVHGPLVRRLQAHWAATAPDLVVSMIPNFNHALGDALARARPGAPFVTILTDLADLPSRFWIEPRVVQHVVCGTPRAQAQALAAGIPPKRLSLVSGMLLRPAFYEPFKVDRNTAREALGFDPGRPVLAVMYGSQGSRAMLRIAQRLPNQQLLLFTGENIDLARRLRAMQAPAARAVIGFTSDVPELLRLADAFVGKPGPGALSEALHLGLPVVTFDNAWTLPQERYNTRWIREMGVGLVLRSIGDLPRAMTQLWHRLPELQRCVGRIDNRALFEVPAILAGLLLEAGRRIKPESGTGSASTLALDATPVG